MNSQTQKQQKRNGIISITLILAILVASAFALLVAKDSKTNVFEIGKVNIQLWEKFDTDLDGVAEVYDDTVETPPVVTKLLPSKSVEKNPYVKNVGNTDAWVFLTVGIPTATDEAIAQSEFGTNNRVQVCVQAYAIQKDYKDKTTAAAVWSDYFDNATQYGEERTSDETELFTLNGIENNQNWTCIDTEPYRANGYNYYTYAYKSLLAPNASTEADYLFNSVTLIEGIGTDASSNGSGSDTDSHPVVSTTVPQNCLYTSGADTWNPGETYPVNALDGDIFNDSYYEYHLNEYYDTIAHEWRPSDKYGWAAKVIDSSLSAYPSVFSEINGVPVTSLEGTYNGCYNLTALPAIPNSVLYTYGMCMYSGIRIADLRSNNSLTKLDANAFESCPNLEYIYFSDTMTDLSAAYCLDCNPDVFSQLVLPDNLSVFSQIAITNCYGISSITYKDITYTSATDIVDVLTENGVTISDGTQQLLNTLHNTNLDY